MANENNGTKEFDELFSNNNAESHETNQGISEGVNDNQGVEQRRMIVPPVNDADAERVKRETYTDEELQDVNKIIVNISDDETPIVVLFGSPASGKTLALLRMIRFLEEESGKKYEVIADPIFRPQTDKHYARMCNGLKMMPYNDYTPGGTDIISFMLVKVSNEVGKPICQILEAPGEHYFDNDPNFQFPTYIKQINSSTNRKIWIFFVEQNWGVNPNERSLYVQAINKVKIGKSDKVVFLFNKVDKFYDTYIGNTPAIVDSCFKQIEKQYKGIFTKFQNKGIGKFLFGKYNCERICFSSGDFNKTQSGQEVWIVGDQDRQYCQRLWDTLPVPNK